ncbi:chitobiase/beta-hexosaminidase C-terminal domain-containing protein [Clostridium saccharoperbutylacetonicum]|nr:chitobiase/beta-hexosaminidase C-terminal domain-containing protein [Clostridium saccharoperbutylacetonicum]
MPTTSSTVYKSPITISKTTILRAIATKSGELLC